MVDEIIGEFLGLFKMLLLRNKWPSVDRIKNVACPILYMSSKDDDFIPQEHMLTLYENAKQAEFAEFYSIENAGHMNGWSTGYWDYIDKFGEFMEECPAIQERHQVSARNTPLYLG